MSEQTPTIGRIVHYVSRGEWVGVGEHLAAIIADVDTDGVEGEGLSVFPPYRSVYYVDSVPHSETGEPGTWHWPERV